MTEINRIFGTSLVDDELMQTVEPYFPPNCLHKEVQSACNKFTTIIYQTEQGECVRCYCVSGTKSKITTHQAICSWEEFKKQMVWENRLDMFTRFISELGRLRRLLK